MPKKNRKQEGGPAWSRLTVAPILATLLWDIPETEEEFMVPAASSSHLGFAIHFRLTDGLGEDGALELWDDFIAGPLGARGLACDSTQIGGNGLSRLLYRPNASATEDDRHVVREWARRRGEIAGYDIGPLTAIGSVAPNES